MAYNETPPFHRTVLVDWKETPTSHVFILDVPGLTTDDVNLLIINGNMLDISGHRNRQQQQETDTWHMIERGSGYFYRLFRLPADPQVHQIQAAVDNGVLTVTVPKQGMKMPNIQPINISG